jgi:phage-related minor tail protein
VADLSLVFDLLARDRASSEVGKVGDAMKGAGDQADGFGDRVSGMFAGLAGGAAGAGLAVGAAFGAALEAQGANRDLTAQLGLDPAESAAAGKMAGDLFAGNYGDSLEGVNDAVGAVASSIDGLGAVGSAAMQNATRDTLNFASAFDVDVNEAAGAAGNLIRNGLAPDATAAFDLMTASFQKVPAAMREELPDILNEYGTNFSALGFSGEQAFGLLTSAAQNGQIYLDKTGDAMKEFTIRGSDMSTTSVAAFQAIGLNAQDMSNAIATGGPAAQDALQKTAQGILGIEDPATRANTAIALFGTPLEDLGVDQIPTFLSSIAGIGPGMTDASGAAAGLDATLSSGIGPRLETLKRGAQQAATEGMTALINGFTEGGTSAGGWQGGLQNLAASLSGTFGPALSGVSSFVTGTVAPALGALFGFLSENQTTVTVIAGLITGVLAAAFAVWGTRSTAAAAQNTVAWFSTALSSQTGSATQQRSALQVVAGWVLMGAQALLNGLKVAAVWTVQMIGAAVTGAASFAVSVASVVAGWVVMGAQAVANGARVVAGWVMQGAAGLGAVIMQGVAVAGIVAGWVLMGVQSMLQAARMAAAWLIAMGPVGWIIALVVGLVALVIANWETVKGWTIAAWEAISGAVSGAWDAVTGAVSAGIDAVVSFVSGLPGKAVAALSALGSMIAGVASSAWTLFSGAVTTGIETAVGFVSGLPGKLVAAAGALGTLLLDAGGDLLRGLWNGISGATSWLLGKVGSFFGNLLPGWVKDMLGISSPSRVFAEFGRYSMQGFAAGIDDEAATAISAAERAALGVTDRVASLTDLGALGAAVDAAMMPSGRLGYTAPRYELGGGAATAAGVTTINNTTINAAPTIPTEDQLSGVYRRTQLLAPRRS